MREGRVMIDQNRILHVILITTASLILLTVFAGAALGYTNVTNICISCHNDTGYPDDTDMNGIAAPYKRPHNNTVMCEYCHTTNPHNMTYIQPNGTYGTRSTAATCIDCHQKGIPAENNTYFTSAYILKNKLHHSNDPHNGSLWKRSGENAFWTDQVQACVYCHGDSKHNTTAFGKPSNFKGSNKIRQFGTWCTSCHYQRDALYDTMIGAMGQIPPEITRNGTYGNYGISTYYNHGEIGSYQDTKCMDCHGNRANVSEFVHDVTSGGGAPNCISCHDVGASGAPKHINVSAMNQSDSIHKDLNKDAVTSLNPDNKRCWACHGNGTEPTKHPDNYKNPYTCTDCHAGNNTNFTPPNTIPVVSQHYWNGTQIITNNVSSCYQCHNKSEMMIKAYDPDLGTINNGTNTGNDSVSHYGRKRTDLASIRDTRAYCDYCHNSTSSPSPSFFDVFLDVDNRSIQNHSRYATNPTCQDCHSNGRIHDASLTFQPLTLPTSTLCISCHGPGGNASINNKNKHNNTVDCSTCHLNDSKGIHPIKYLNNTGGLNLSKEQGVTCNYCHESGRYSAPATGELHHSNNPGNGSLWSEGRPSAFWNNNTPSTACEYCHGNSKHNISALGKPVIFKGSNSVGVFGTWCGTCHYQSNNQYSNMLNTLNPEIPPEITKNSTYGNYATPMYYDHSGIGNYQDVICTNCHGKRPDITSSMHKVTSGGFSPDCISCHDIGATGSPKHVNVSAMNRSDSIHKDLNKDAVSSVNPDNKRCWACHGNLTEPTKHPANYKNPYTCTDCHAGSNRNFTPSNTILTVSQHYWNGTQIITSNISSCYQCHNKSEMMVRAYDPDTGTINNGTNTGNDSVSHYGKKRSDLVSVKDTKQYCDYCHNSTATPSSSFFDVFSDMNNRNIQNHSRYATNPRCQDCHSTGRIHNASLTFQPLTLPASTLCLSCHGPGGNASINNKNKHNNTVDCSTCHLGDGRGIHPVKYLNNSGEFTENREQGVKCSYCHESGRYSAPAVGKIRHSSNTWNGSLWSEGRPSPFWDNNTPSTACVYCHGNSKHNASALGKPILFEGTNTLNIFGTWCGACHSQSNAQYRSMLNAMNPLIPPEISSNLTYGNYVKSRDGTSYFNHSLSTFMDNECKYCHYSGVPANLTALMHNIEIGGTSCTGCHSIPNTTYFINTSTFEKHANISKTDGFMVVSDSDCKGCHFDVQRIDQMKNGYANFSNTYFCQDCHNSSGRNPAQYNNITNITLIKNAMPPGHAQNRCEQCHIAGDDESRPLPQEYRYHNSTNGPKGTAARKNCYSCHFRSDGARFGTATVGLRDKPFNAPGEAHGCADGCHSVAPGQERPPLTDCQNCHGAGSPDITHAVNIGGHYGSEVTSIGVVGITSPVNASDTATVSAIVDSTFTQVARAQYRINDSTNTLIIRDWTEMNASDGKFNENSEPVVGYIDTTGLSGNYIVLVRGMSSAATTALPDGINHDTSKPYFPYNGAWTDTVAVGLEVKGTIEYKVLASGQIYGGSTSWRTNFRAGDYGTNNTNASINFYNPSGTLINSTNTTIPRYASANYQWKDYAPGVSDGTALITSKEPVSVITFQRMDTDGKLGFWEGIPLNAGSTEVFVSGLLYSPGGWRSGFKVLNVENTAANVTMYFYNSSGKLINTITRSVASKASPYFDWYTYGYNVSGGSTDGTVKAVSNRRIHITASQAAESTGKLGFWEGVSLNTDSTQVFVSGLLYSPGGWRSGFKVANYNDTSASVTIYFYNASGNVANTITRTIASKTSPYFDWYTYGYNITNGSTDGTALVVSNKPVKVVTSQAIETQGIVDFYQAPQISGNNTAYVIYQVYDGIERSGIKVANPGNASISAVIKFYDQSGHLVNTTTRTIAPKTSPNYAWNSYAPGVTTGSVVIEATGRIIAIASITGEQPGKLGIFRGIDLLN